MRLLASHNYRVFATTGFSGNPVTLHAVDSLSDDDGLYRSALASTTADNVYYCASGADSCLVRFFSPGFEIRFCGHGLLALAWHFGAAGSGRQWDAVAPDARKWTLQSLDDTACVHMPAASELVHGPESAEVVRLLEALEVSFERLHAFEDSVWVAVTRSLDAMLALRADLLQQYYRDFAPFGALILTTRMSESCYALRYFAPWYGKLEDSATGSAQGCLARLWLQSGQRSQVLQYGPQGVAEMTVERNAEIVLLRGTVES